VSGHVGPDALVRAGRARLLICFRIDEEQNPAELRPAGRTRASAPAWCVLVPALVFSQYHGEAAAAKTEPLRNSSSDAHSGAIAGHAVSLAVNPHLTRAVVHLVDTRAESPERTAHSSTDRNFPPCVPPRITKDSPDVGACRTSGQDQRSHDEQ
jgi:hypothetical protein